MAFFQTQIGFLLRRERETPPFQKSCDASLCARAFFVVEFFFFFFFFYGDGDTMVFSTAFCASSRNDCCVFSSSSSSMKMIRRRRLELSRKNPSTSFSKNPPRATMERSDTTTTATTAKDGTTKRRANRRREKKDASVRLFSVLVDRGGVVVDRVRDAFLSVQSDGTITTKKKKKKRRKAEDEEKDDAVVFFSARETRRKNEEETTAIENAVWPRELVREEEAMREKDPDDFDFDGEEDFVASLAKNELFRNFSAETRGFAVFNFIIFIMGSNIVLVKMAQENISPDAFGLFRFLTASLTFMPFTKYALRDSKILKMGVELGFWCALGYYFQAIGLDITDASSAAFISSFTVISVPLIAVWAGRKVPKSTWVAIAVAIFGLALIEGVVPIPGLEAHDTKEAISIVSDAVSDVVSTSVLSGEVVQTNPFEVLDSALSLPLESVDDIAEVATVETVQSLYGDFAILISAFVFAVQVFRTDVLANEKHLGTKEMMGMCSIQLFVVTLFFGGTLLNKVPHDDGSLSTFFSNSIAELSAFHWHDIPWFLVLYTGVISTAFALYAETVALKYIPSEKASVLYTTEPLWGAAFAYVLLGERMGVNGYVGGALILASSFLSSNSNEAMDVLGEEEEEEEDTLKSE